MEVKQSKFKLYFTHKEFLLASLTSILFLALSLVVNFYAGTYATEKASNPVTDIILSNTRAFDLGGIFVFGAIVFYIFLFILFFFEPEKLPFTLDSIALFTIIRSIFVSLTHIGPFPSQSQIPSTLLEKFSFGGDLFFSGHTGIPFLMALIFWKNRYLRLIFLASSVSFGIVVLLAHLHYSIDVLSAFFITYTIFHISVYLFKKDRELFYRRL